MENSKAFRDRDVIAICEHITNYCETNICSLPLGMQSARSFYLFLPELLVILFGSPTTSGLLQSNLESHQSTAFKKLLNIDSPFIQSLISLSQNKEYCYDLTTESLPADVRKVLSSGATQLLPGVYSNYVSSLSATTAHSIDIYTSARTQSTLLPANVSYEMKIQFNMIQFYLYYFANIPTWMKASSSEPLAPNCSNKTLGLNTTFGLKKTPKPISTPIVLQPQLTATIYTDVLEQYLVRLVPIHGNMSSSPVGRFYLDALVELWIRTPWIPSNGKLDPTLMFYISHFMKYIVRNDLKNCVERSTAYEAIRDEFYMLVSRLALNWEKTDGYIQVIELWSLWASAWRRSAPIRSKENEIYQPVQKGWTPFIMDNIPYYFSLVEIFLERTSQFSYVDDTTSLAGQLRSLYRIMNLFKAQDVLQVLALIERSLDIPSIDTIYTQQLAQLAGTSERYISTKIQKSSSRLAELEGRYPWRSKGLYTLDQRRSPCLIGSLAKLFDAINLPEPNIRSVPRPPRHVEQLEEAYGLFVNLFQLHDHQPYRALNGSAPAIGLFEIEYAGLKNGGFLTPEELEKIKQGKLTCSSRSIPALGIRAQTVVRSYENATLVLWSIRIDKYINETYDEWIPIEYRSTWLPLKFSTRPFARTVNFIYTCALLLFLLYVFFKILF